MIRSLCYRKKDKSNNLISHIQKVYFKESTAKLTSANRFFQTLPPKIEKVCRNKGVRG